MHSCPWCSRKVEVERSTCDISCYRTWVYWHQKQAINPSLLQLQPFDEVPLDLREQPWFDATVGVEEL